MFNCETVVDLESIRSVKSVLGGKGVVVDFGYPNLYDSFSRETFQGGELYLSTDLHASILAYLEMQYKMLRDGTSRYGHSSPYVGTGKVIFALRLPIWDFEPESLERLPEVINNLSTGFILNYGQWTKVGDTCLETFNRESYNYPERNLILCPDSGIVGYGTGAELEHDLEYSKDIALINLADKLHGIASTSTFPDAGYNLSLELGLGKLDIATLDKDLLRLISAKLSS